MTPFLCNETFLLPSETARELYHTAAAPLPIADWHCHLPVREIAENQPCGNLAQMWLGHDHYKWRAMRCLGVTEAYITGDAGDWDKFLAWAQCMPRLIGNPLYHWSHLELRRFFGIEDILCPDSAADIYARANEQLAGLTVRDLMIKSNVELVCTTDDPADTLEWHKQLRDEYESETFDIKVLPAFRADNILQGDSEYIKRLGETVGIDNSSRESLAEIMAVRARAFAAYGCRAADFSAMTINPDDELLQAFAAICAENDWVMEAHLSVQRNVNPIMFAQIGRDCGGDVINQPDNLVRNLAMFFNKLESEHKLPKTLLFSLNPSDNAALCALSGSYGDKIRQGSAWWFNDTLPGMREQLITYASMLPLSAFPGFVTDSRSFLSYPRHEYFRRLFCGIVGDWVEQGEYPRDWAALTRLVKDVCYDSAMTFFGF